MIDTHKIRLKGNAYDLEKVSKVGLSNLLIEKSDDGYYYLQSEGLNANCNIEIIDQKIDQIQVIQKLAGEYFYLIDVDTYSLYSNQKPGSIIALISASMTGKSVMTASSGQPQIIPDYDVLLDPKYNTIVFHFSGDSDWVDLYKVYELIRNKCGIKNIKENIPEARIKAFTASANSPKHSGPSARHAVSSADNASAIMSIKEAEEFIKDLVLLLLITKTNFDSP